MICRFETKPAAAAMGAACPPPAAAPAVGAQGAPPSLVAGVSSGPLAPVLARLVGREVKVVAGCHCYAGRVLQNDPLTLIGPSGEVLIIAQPPSSVQY